MELGAIALRILDGILKLRDTNNKSHYYLVCNVWLRFISD